MLAPWYRDKKVNCYCRKKDLILTKRKMNIPEILKDKKKLPLIIAGGALLLILLLVMVLLIAKKPTNGPSDPDSNSEDGGNTNNPTTSGELVYWGLWESEEVMANLIKEFEDANPGVTVKYSAQTFLDYESRLYKRLLQTTETNEPAPDIVRIHNTWLPKFESLLSKLPSNIMSRDEYSEKFYPTALSDFTGKDQSSIYAVPLEIDGLMVFYNKQLLSEQDVSEPPVDWDKFLNLARKLTKRDSSGRITQAGLAIGSSNNVLHSSEILLALLLQEEFDLLDSTRTKISLNNDNAKSVFTQYTNFAIGNNAVWSPDSRSDLNLFYSGKLAMMIAPSWRVFDIIKSNPKIEFGTAPFPKLPANDNEVYYSTYWGEAVNKKSQNTELAWKFVKFLSEKEQQLQMYSDAATIGERAFGEPYSLKELNAELKGKAYVDAIAKMAPYMRSFQLGEEDFVRKALEEAVTQILNENKSVETALKEAETTINTKLAQSNK